MSELPPVGRRGWQAITIASVAVFMVSVEITIISLAFPEIRARFPETSESTLSWVITAYNIGVASLLLIGGWLADRYGRRRAFTVGLAIFAFGSLLAGTAQSSQWLIAARVVQSVGGALQYPAGLALLLAAVPPLRHQLAIGIWGATGALAAATGPTLGGLLVEGFGWRAVFLINVPIAIGGVLLARHWLERSVAEDVVTGVDIISVPLASIGVGAMILGIVQGEHWGWLAGKTVGTFVTGVVLVAIFVVRSRTHPAPLFDLELLRLRSFSVANLATLFFAVAFFSWLVTLPSLIQNVWGWSVLKTGFAIAPGPFLAFLIAPVVGRIADQKGNRPMLIISGVAGTVALLLLRANFGAEPSYVTDILLPGFFMGIAAGTGFSQLVGGAMRDVPPHRYAMAGAGRTTLFQLSVAVGIAVGIAVVGRPESAAAALDSYGQLWLVGATCFALMACSIAVLYPRLDK